MTCEDVGPFLPVLSDASLPDQDRRGVEAHLSVCPKCRAARDRQERLAQLIAPAGRVPDPGEDFWKTQREALLRRASAEPRGLQALPSAGRGRTRLWIAAAAAVLLAAGAALWATGLLRIPAAPSASPEARNGSSAPHDVAQPPRAPEVPKNLVTQAAPAPSPQPPTPTPVRSPEAPRPQPVARSSEDVLRMTDEMVDIGLAETPADRVRALYHAAEARLGELREAMGRDPELAAELASAYVMLLSDGVRSVLGDGAESPAALAAAKDLAALRARSHETVLAALGTSATGKLKETLDEALATSRALARP
jgi:type IV secretory pathway VirB10-like protein